MIREYLATDARAIEACIVELQDYERRIDPRLRPGSSMAAEYLAQTLARCNDYTGRVFVAECANVVAGFTTVLARMPFLELDDPRPASSRSSPISWCSSASAGKDTAARCWTPPNDSPATAAPASYGSAS